MVYIILVFGLVIIYLSLRSGRKTDNTGDPGSNGSSLFSSLLDKRMDKDEIESLKDEISYLMVRIDDLEKAVMQMNINSNFRNTGISLHSAAVHEEFIKENFAEETKAQLPSASEKTDHENEKSSEANNAIYKLFDEGKSVEEISSILRIGKGEILLRLGLRKKQNR